MNDSVKDEGEQDSIEDLLRRKAELQEINSGLAAKIEDGETIKVQLKEARRDSHKLLHHREKLKNRMGKQFHDFQTQNSDIEQHSESKEEEKNQVTSKTESLPNTEIQKDEESSINHVPLRRALNALRIENSSLVKEKRKGEEQRDNLVQELADLNTKHENLQSLCDKLKKEIERLSSFVGKSSNEKRNEKEEDIEMVKAQLCLYQEEMNGMQAQIKISERSNQRLRAELNEARAVIRDLRKAPPYEMYPAAVYHPIYRTYEDRYAYEPLDYPMVRSGSGGYLTPMREEYRRRRRTAPTLADNKLFMPDLTAVVDYNREVEDKNCSLISSKSY